MKTKQNTYKIMNVKHGQKHADRHGYTYILHVYMCFKTYICMRANANTKYMCRLTHTYGEEYMHMHAHLVFTLYVKYLQVCFVLFLYSYNVQKCFMN